MKKIFTSFLLLSAVALSMNATAINEQEAGDIARQFWAGKATTQMRAASNATITTAFTVRSNSNDNLLYVFNQGENEGFVIIAGDNSVDNAVLGYCDSGSFDYNNIPDNMRWWLDQYAEQIELGRNNPQRAKAEAYVSKFDKNVGPLVEARWSQEAPYNNLCPNYSTTMKSATGCVATAMAQIMYHHKYPEHGVGTKDVYIGSSVEVIDFANTTYEWDVMTPVYSSLSTQAECDAVATLMYHVGRSVDMSYGEVSGAVSSYAATAWANHWNYDKGMVHRERAYYTIDEWETMIMEDIDNSRPILYHGQSPTGGHAFVLDGYNSEGYVHINWGWNGMSNGYFLLHALSPEEQGTGGFSGGYNNGQGAIFGIQPNRGNLKTIELTADGLDIDFGTYDLGTEIPAGISKLANSCWDVVNIDLGYMIYDANNQLVDCINCDEASLNPITSSNASNFISAINLPFTLPATLAAGEYKLYLAHTDAYGEWKRVAMNVNTQPFYTFQVEGNQATFIADEEGEIFATSVVCNEENIYSKRYSNFTITMSNTMSHEYFGSIYVSIYNSTGKFEQRKSDAIALSIPAQKEITIDIPIKIEVSKGNYCIFITDGDKNKLSESYPITVLAEPTNAQLVVSDFTLKSEAKDLLQAEYTVTNNGGDYTGYLRAWVLFSSRQRSSSYCNTDEVTIKNGESMTINATWEFEDGVVGETYICSLWYEDNRKGGMSQIGTNEISFTLKEPTALESVTDAHVNIYPNPAQEYLTITHNAPITVVTIYNLQGAMVASQRYNSNTATLNVASLPAGTYIVKAATAQGTIVEKIVIL